MKAWPDLLHQWIQRPMWSVMLAQCLEKYGNGWLCMVFLFWSNRWEVGPLKGKPSEASERCGSEFNEREVETQIL